MMNQDITRSMLHYMQKKYTMRFNAVMGYTEMRVDGTTDRFVPVDERMRNTIAIDARLDGINVWDKDVKRYVESHFIPVFNPVSDFLNRVRGCWDGRNHIETLARFVQTDTPAWPSWFHTWFLGMVAQWMGLNTTHGNSVAPLLISKQGFGKSTFCKQLLPPELQWGYNDNLLMGDKKGALLAMTQYLLINIDEFNSISQKVQEGFLKNVLQLVDVKVKRPYGRSAEVLPRMASFIGTANMSDVLTDPSGCRRFMAITLQSPIVLPRSLNYRQLYAQAVDELSQGRRHWFDDQETAAMMQQNEPYRHRHPIEAFFHECFAVPATASEGEYLTAAHIFTSIKQRIGLQLPLHSLSHFGRVLANVPGLQSRHGRRGTEYLVTPLL